MSTLVIKHENVCSRESVIEYEGDIVTKVTITGGCQGNTQGVAALMVGRKISDIVKALEGIKCRGSRDGITSCPDQIAKGLKQLLQ